MGCLLSSRKAIIESDDNIDQEIDASIMNKNLADYRKYLFDTYGHTNERILVIEGECVELFRARIIFKIESDI